MSTEENTKLATCRLGRIEGRFLKVLENLNFDSLIRMSTVNNYFKELITKWIIGKKLFKLSELSQASRNAILETFGKSMTKFTITEMNLNNFLGTVMKYCSPATLVEVELSLKELVKVDSDKIEQSMTFFTKLHKIKLDVLINDTEQSFDDFLKLLLATATNLHSLQLHHVSMAGEWFTANQLENLREFRLIEPINLCPIKLTDFIRNLPNLEIFSFKGFQDIKSIGSSLATCCPKLKKFANIHMSGLHHHADAGVHPYIFLSSFSQLRYITLTSYTFCASDLFHPLVELASKNIVKLRIFIDFHNAEDYSGTDRERIMRTSFAHFRSLREIELCVRNFIGICDLECNFIMHLATQLKNLDTFSLTCRRLANANKIIELLPKLNKLSMSEVSFNHLPVEMRKIVRTLRTIRQAAEPNNKRKLLKLLVNTNQWKELQVYKDVKNLVEITLDPVDEPFNYGKASSPLFW